MLCFVTGFFHWVCFIRVGSIYQHFILKYRIPEWPIFFIWHFKNLICLLASSIFDKPIAIQIVPLYVMGYFILNASKIFLLSVAFIRSTTISQCSFLCIYAVWGLLNFLNLKQMWEMSSNILWLHLSLLSCWDFNNLSFHTVHRSLRLSSLFSPPFSPLFFRFDHFYWSTFKYRDSYHLYSAVNLISWNLFQTLHFSILTFPFGSFYILYFSAEISYLCLHYTYILFYLSEHSYNSCIKVLLWSFQQLGHLKG